METKKIITIAKIVSWIVFIGLCINAGGLLISTIVDYFSSNNSGLLYNDLDLSILKDFSISYYLYIISFLIFIAFLKAYVWYLVLRLFSNIDLDQPFTLKISTIISSISYFTVVIGITAIIAKSYDRWLMKKSLNLDIDWGATEYVFMAGVLFVVGLIIKRGVEIQMENELTI